MARRTPSPDQLQEIARLQARLTLICRFIETEEDFPIGSVMRQAIEQAAKSNDLRGLRMMERDYREMMTALLPDDRKRLDMLLQSDPRDGSDSLPPGQR